MQNKKPKILLLSEARVTTEINSGEIAIDNYQTLRCDSINRNTGGLLIYVQKNICCHEISSKFVNKSWFLAIKVTEGFQKGVYGVVYKSPQDNVSQFMNEFENWCEEIVDLNDFCLIVGDFNINVALNDNNSKKLIDIGKRFHLEQRITEPTRETASSNTVIDLLFTNCDKILHNIDNVNNISDHNIIEIKLCNNMRNDKPKIVKKDYWIWSNYSRDKLANELFEVDWELYHNCVDMDSKADCLINLLDCAVKRLVFKKPAHDRPNQPWYNNELRKMKNEVKHLKYEFNQCKNEDRWKIYHKKRNEYKYELKKAENNYVKNKIDKSKKNGRLLWKNIKELYDSKKNEINTVKFNNIVENDPVKIAKNFNSFFVESLNQIRENIQPSVQNNYLDKIKKNDNKFIMEPVTLNKLKKILSLVKNKNYVDNINGKVLNDAIENPIFAVEFCKLINEILLTGAMPSSWKVSTIVPIKKVANAKSEIQFRPINMLPIYEKVLELIIKQQLLKFIMKNDILIKEQSGFRERHSCESALNEVINYWLESMQEDKYVVCIFLDLKRAFETVDRNVLLMKLKLYGIEHEFFVNYLDNRKHCTKFNEIFSEKISCDIGLPQGSGLAPLLFILYINDLIKNLHNLEVKLFADDTLLMISGNDVNSLINKANEDLSTISDWLNFNYLSLNIEKTKAMIISLKNINYDSINKISISNNIIDFVTEYKYLGVWIDCKLNFNKHTEMLVNKMISKLQLFKRLSKRLNCFTLSLLYKSLVAPNIDYCSSILFMLNDTQVDKIQKVQNRFMRLILKAPWLTPIKDMLDNLKWKSIKQKICFNTLKFIFKILNGETPQYLTEKLTQRKDVMLYNLRSSSRYNVPQYTKDRCQKGLFYGGLNMFNDFKSKHSFGNLTEFHREAETYVRENF